MAGWWKYDERTNKEIESSYQSEETSCQVMVVGLLFVVDFSRMLQYRVRDPTKRRKIKRDVSSAPMKGIAGISLRRLDGTDIDGPEVLADNSGDAGGNVGAVALPLRGDEVSQGRILHGEVPSPASRATELAADHSVRRRRNLTVANDGSNREADQHHSLPTFEPASSSVSSVRSRYHGQGVPNHSLLEEFQIPDDLSDDSPRDDRAVENIMSTLERFQLLRFPRCYRDETHEDCRRCCCQAICVCHHPLLHPHCFSQHCSSSTQSSSSPGCDCTRSFATSSNSTACRQRGCQNPRGSRCCECSSLHCRSSDDAGAGVVHSQPSRQVGRVPTYVLPDDAEQGGGSQYYRLDSEEDEGVEYVQLAPDSSHDSPSHSQ